MVLQDPAGRPTWLSRAMVVPVARSNDGVRQATQGPQPEHRGDPHDWLPAICRQEVLGVRFPMSPPRSEALSARREGPLGLNPD
jgi:hypothetical protein